MRISRLTFIGFYLNGAISSGNYADISIDDVKEKIRKHTLFEYLESKLGAGIGLNVLTPEDKQVLMTGWKSLADNVDEARRMRVDRNGLCLLVAVSTDKQQQTNSQSQHNQAQDC